jgi:hypothetical protein
MEDYAEARPNYKDRICERTIGRAYGKATGRLARRLFG